MATRNTAKNTGKEKKKLQEDTAGKNTDGENVKAAHEQAEEDILHDADLSIHSPNDDLDEAETARLGEDKTDMV